jgi:LysM repeat protein
MKKTDYISWAHGLKKAGYATDPQYAYKLISLIERYELWQFDGSKAPLKKSKRSKQEQTYVVKQGDTLYSIAKKFKLTVDKIVTLNSLNSTDLAIGQQLKLK